jgi:hypothetical protein
MDYGTDFLLIDDDIVFTSDGDIALVSGTAMVAQDIDQTLKVSKGSLYWDKETGSTMPLMLNDSESDATSIIAELERVAIADARVNPETVKAYQTAPGKFRAKFRIEFTPMSAVLPEILEYDLVKGREQ